MELAHGTRGLSPRSGYQFPSGHRVMGSHEEYLKFAQECTRWAAECDNEKDRQAFLQLAEDWTRAAFRAQSQAIDTAMQVVGDKSATKLRSRS
jgi:hypothetical protein